MDRHPVEALESWKLYQGQGGQPGGQERSRQLKRKHKVSLDKDNVDLTRIEHDQEKEYLQQIGKKTEKDRRKAEKKHKKLLREMYANPGIRRSTVHGIMIDAGSTGSRLHLYEWEPRILNSHKEVELAVSGKKLSYPESTSRWTDRLRPGIATFADQPNDELVEAVAEYLAPLLDFAKTTLREKEEQFETFPIFLRATAGMRTLDKNDRKRVLSAVRTLFSNNTFCPFYFEDEYARILSGEEEAIFGWTGINFAMGNLVEESEGAGTVINPKLTYGALDMGGASTQISFYEPNEDIMANLFKLQIGQGKHWNLYAHSFLYYGINEARNRYQARLLYASDDSNRLVDGVHNPCLPGGSEQEVRLNIHFTPDGDETWEEKSGVSEDGFYQGLFRNLNSTGDFDKCMELTKSTLHLEKNTWCDFAHKGECSFNGVSMPELPAQSENFGEFLAFSNYYHVWNFLGLPERASLQELHDATRNICGMTEDELLQFNKHTGKEDAHEALDYCFRSAYVFNILRHGYGFDLDEHITATEVLNGQKVGWALGAMLYEINTFPWDYVPKVSPLEVADGNDQNTIASMFVFVTLLGILVSTLATFACRRRRIRQLYAPLKEVSINV